ncbi:MAG: hypothetical protein K0R50_1113, partial [Eubacterium sp.]|nr:hypothetical protein [Eubacterium sp.]
MIKKRYAFSVFVFTVLFLICANFTNQSLIASAAAKSSQISLNAFSTYLLKGETTTLKVTGTSQKVVWSSSNSEVASVSSSGKVTAAGYGRAYINAAVNKKEYSCEITVINPEKISFEPAHTTVFVGGAGVSMNPVSYTYNATAMEKIGISYKVTGNSGVKVSSTGLITASSAGDFKIIASIHGKEIRTINMIAVTYDGFTVPELWLETNIEEYAGFAKGILPLMKDVEITSTNSEIAV